MNGMTQGGPVAAIATAQGPAGIAVVRLSGPGALGIADKLCAGSRTPPSSRPGGTFGLYRLKDPTTGEFLDEALVLVFRAPHSYTGEDAARSTAAAPPRAGCSPRCSRRAPRRPDPANSPGARSSTDACRSTARRP